MRTLLGTLVLTGILLSGCTTDPAESSSYASLDVHAWKAAYEATPDAFLLDVRTPAEYEEAHLANATLIPYDELEARADELPSDPDIPIFVYCRSGNRSAIASETLLSLGHTDITDLDGGIIDWVQAGYATA